ncbi:MAG: undecaprenyl-diphosphate phosphatase [Pseudoprimorskyibacter sp.]|nr:undecaprenyl-diphosphate phosphatase [Pseudoprimorskyibacter sp.]
MPLFNLLILAIIQGVTEFLPISSSGHLILLPKLTGMQDQGLMLDVAVHVGTLFAVMIYFRRDVALAVSGVPDLLRGRITEPGARLAGLLIIATVPVIIVGLILNLTGLETRMRSIAVIGWTMLGFGLVLYWADRLPQRRVAESWNMRDAVIMGLWQALALIPGTSRSGITITGARVLGFDRDDSARLAMLMSIPTIIASGALLGIEAVATANANDVQQAAVAACFAFLSALIALAVMMRLLTRISFTPYVVYRVVLGGVLLWIAYSGTNMPNIS